MPNWTKEQLRAIHESGTNILVNAGAGSGKTAVLTTRVIEKLKKGIHINELLILTFTKAAASEMKDRIRNSLKKLPELKQELLLLDSSYITTFDAFSLSIVKKYHYLLNITSSPEIADETLIEILRKDTLREVLDRFYEKNDLDFLKMIEEYCVKDDENFYTCMLSIGKKFEKIFSKEEMFDYYETDFFKEENITKIIKEFENLCLQKQEQIKENLEELKRIASKDYFEKCIEGITGLLNAKDFDTFIMYRSCKLPAVPKNSEEEVKEAKEKVAKSIKELTYLIDYGDKLSLKQDLEKSKSIISVICRILREYLKELENRKKEAGYFDFNDIAFLGLKILKKFPNVREEIKNSLKEIMIDEYQDTNNIQEAFISLIANNNVFMVGDIKQSIYRFRDANPYLFQTKYDAYRKKQGGEKIDLLQNFRSRKEVLFDINKIFNLLMLMNFGGADYIAEHQMEFGNKSYETEWKTDENYHMELLTYDNEKESDYKAEEKEAFLIGRDIQKKIKDGYKVLDKESGTIHPVTYKDFVILMDRSSNFDLYKKIFQFLNIPISIQKDESLNSSILFPVIRNLFHLLVSYHKKNFDSDFKHSFVSVARSFLFEIKDKDIYDMVKENRWYQNLIYEKLHELIQKITYKTLPEITNELYISSGIYENIIKIGNIKESKVILKHIKELAFEFNKQGKSVEDFAEYLNRITKDEMEISFSINETEENSVKIMTIHKSKGLEFPICYLSGLYKKFNITDIKESFLFEKEYGFIVPLKEEGIYQSFLKELAKQKCIQEELSEKVRLFYVAMTRAKEKMIFVLPKMEKESTYTSFENRLDCRSFRDFLNLIWKELKLYQKEAELEKLGLSKEYLFSSSKPSQIFKNDKQIEVEEISIKIEEEETKTFSKTRKELLTKQELDNMKLGIKVHEYLEWVDFQNPNYNLIENSFLRNKIKKFIESPMIQENINNPMRKEYEFIYEEEKEYHGVIDLLIEQEDKIIIIDYKLDNVVDEAYQKQLEGYRNYIEKKSKKEVLLYLYSILNENIILIENQSVMV